MLLWYFLKLLSILILVLKENDQDQAHIFQDKYLESSQMYQLIMMHCFEHIFNNNPLILS